MATQWFDANPYLNLYSYGTPVRSAYHTGSDLNLNTPTWDADRGAGVYAVAAGVVTFAAMVPNSTWGKLVVIRHRLNDGMIVHSRYGHLAGMSVSAGAVVSRGQQIGTIGGVEYGVANHLHFDISHSGILESNPTHWPGTNRQSVIDNYLPPRPFLEARLPVAPPPPPPPPPPPSGAVYSTAFMDAEPAAWRVIRRIDGSGEDVWDLSLGSGRTVRVKNRTEGEWYERRAAGLFRLFDTSPAPDSQGTPRLYALYQSGVLGGQIAPAQAEVGRVYSYTNTVQFKAKSGCHNLGENSGTAVSTFLLQSVIDNYRFPGTGVTVSRLYVTVQTGETQLYAEINGRRLGWVGGGAQQQNNVWGGELAEMYWDRQIPAQEPNRYCF